MLGNSLYHARKKRGLSQENVAEKLGVSRQTVSKWETNETLPDIRQAKHLAVLYQITLDELIDFDADQHSLQQMIDSVSEECQAKTDWTKVWSKKYPVLATYREKEYKLRKSKHLIDKLDDLICPLYGLTKEETDFIKNYEIEFRLDDE